MLAVQAEQAFLQSLLGLPLVLLAVVRVNARKVQRVTYQHRFNLLVERAGTAEGRRDINLEQPRL